MTVFYPVNLDITGRPCLVAGGGQVATRKTAQLLECGARVRVVSPEATPEISRLAGEGRLEWRRRVFEGRDLDDTVLALAATDRPDVNESVLAEARQRGIFCNMATDPGQGDLTLPSVIRRGDLMITVSTGGRSPALSRMIRRTLSGLFGPEYARALTLLGAAREKLLAGGHDPDGHRDRFRALLDGGLIDLLKAGDETGADRLLTTVLGSGYDAATLGAALPAIEPAAPDAAIGA